MQGFLVAVVKNHILLGWKKLKEQSDVIPLSEDIVTQGLSIFAAGREKLNWGFHNVNRVTSGEENMLRLKQLVDFGHYLSKIEDTEIHFDKQNNVFYISGHNGKVTKTSTDVV